MRIHDKSLIKKDKGSEDKGLIYIDFKAGMFEALKVNIMICLQTDFDTKIKFDPKVEYYRGAEERICLDLQMKVNDNIHDVKIKAHTSKCSLDVAGLRDKTSKRFDHLHNLTVGEYFAKHIIVKIVERIENSLDITELNKQLRMLANDGKKADKNKTVNKHCKARSQNLFWTKL